MKLLFALLLVAVSSIATADVRVEIDRYMPDGSEQTVVRQFNDVVEFEMWMEDRIERKGCDPYVTEMKIYLR